jgi:hypothetical protein
MAFCCSSRARAASPLRKTTRASVSRMLKSPASVSVLAFSAALRASSRSGVSRAACGSTIVQASALRACGTSFKDSTSLRP